MDNIKQKTILLPIYNGMRARNFFRTDTYRELVSDPAIRLVVVIPPSKFEYYRQEFPERNVIFEPYEIISEPWFGVILYDIAFNLLNTHTIRYKQKLEYLRSTKSLRHLLRFLVKRILNRTLGFFPFITRPLVRFLDRFVSIDEGVSKLLNYYRPNLVIVPDIVFPPDRVFLRAAKRKNYFALGMIRSWDNLTSKGVIQILPDKLIVSTTVMKQEAMTYAGIAEKDILVSGIPYYDVFFQSRRTKREDFFKKIGADSSCRLVLCAPFFDQYTGSAVVIINALIDAINQGLLPSNVHILVRYRPATPDIPQDFIKSSGRVSILKSVSRYFKVNSIQTPAKDWEFSEEDMEFLLDSLYFSDVVINTISTLSIDAAAFDRPVINVRFDADPNTPPKHSVNLVIQHDHYKAIEDSGGVKLAWNMNELIHAVAAYLDNPKLDGEGRKKMREVQIEFMDGKSGSRVAKYIRGMLASL